ncbi:MAG: DUF2283 domain-containing protein [Thermoleophilia bacterium]|nr:DUF2283 domain-containing protein [Thermoleophilia bacterium]
MRVRFDEQADALYVRRGDSSIVESEELRPGLIVDLDERGEVVGLEILGVAQRVPGADLKHMDFEVG